jgi:hypothetical protein
MKPHRVKLSRAKGWRLPRNTVKVDRTTKWGNPFKVGGTYFDLGIGRRPILDAETAVRLFRERCLTGTSLAMIRLHLNGKNLACWCKSGDPCHADVLLHIANP